MSTRVFRTPKAGNSVEECEDNACPESAGYLSHPAVVLAVADGATESLYSGVWSHVLTRCFGDLAHRDSFDQILARAREVFQKWLKRELKRRELSGRPIQWFEEPGLEAGAFSAICAVTVRGEGSCEDTSTWTATAVGDCCFFQIRGSSLLQSFPITTPEAFGSRPYLVGSRVAPIAADSIHRIQGAGRPGDHLILMSDAAAHWFISEHSIGGEPWSAFVGESAVKSDNEFATWLTDKRESSKMRNDDVVVVVATLE